VSGFKSFVEEQGYDYMSKLQQLTSKRGSSIDIDTVEGRYTAERKDEEDPRLGVLQKVEDVVKSFAATIQKAINTSNIHILRYD